MASAIFTSRYGRTPQSLLIWDQTWSRGHLLFELSDRYVIILSPDIIKESLSVLYRLALRERFPAMAKPAELERVLSLLEQAEVLEPDQQLAVCRDPSDNKFFECAVAGGADYIVSEHRDILDVGEYEGIKTVFAEEFMALLSGD